MLMPWAPAVRVTFAAGRPIGPVYAMIPPENDRQTHKRIRLTELEE
jgi:hypothetical protein